VELARGAKADLLGCAFLIELSALGGRARLEVPIVHSVLDYCAGAPDLAPAPLTR
jgi:adenine/guanine phosphoribosyltransferase-like PRPP-binding protein